MSPDVIANIMEYHVDEHIVTLPGERLLSVVRLRGSPYEAVDQSLLNERFEQLNRFFLAIGKKEGAHLMVQTYITKSPVVLDTEYNNFPIDSISDMVECYTKPFRDGKYKSINYAIVLILKSQGLTDGINRMKELLVSAKTMLDEFDPSIMGVELNRHGALVSQIGRYFSLIFNGYEKDVLLSDTRLGDAVIDSVAYFGGYDFVEVRPNHGGKRFATTYDLRDYPSQSSPGMWDEVIEAPCDFVLVQTFHYVPRNEAKDALKKHANNLTATDGETEQVLELWDARDNITDGKVAFGMYHAALIVYGDTQAQASINGSGLVSMFNNKDTTFVRSTVTNVFTYYAQFPAVTDVVYRSLRSTENLACGFSLNTIPLGKMYGNPVGDGSALMPVMNTKGGLYLLNAHDSPIGQDNRGEKFPGHMSVTGMTGAGKTTLEAAVISMFSRWNPMVFAIDYNRSLIHVLRGLGATYLTITPGQPTGINPFQLPDSPMLQQTLYELIYICVGGKALTTTDEEVMIQRAIEAVLRHEVVGNRGVSLMMQYIPYTGENCLHSRLAKWSRANNGQYAWVIDSPENKFQPESQFRLAFDSTEILKKSYTSKHPEVVEVLLNTLFFMKKMMHTKGQLMLNIIAEYWVPLSFESTAETIKEWLKAGRMRSDCVLMDTQSPEDALSTKYAAAVIQQVPTQIWLPNENAEWDGYMRFGLTKAMFAEIKKLKKNSRLFLVKQGQQAILAKFDLTGDLKYWLPFLSATTENIDVAERVMRELDTNDPNVWVPAYLKRMAENKPI